MSEITKVPVSNIMDINLVTDLTINEVIMIPSSRLHPKWKGSIQVIKTNRGNFIDNPTMVTYQSKRKPILGYKWENEIGKLLIKNSEFVFDVSNGYVWLKHI